MSYIMYKRQTVGVKLNLCTIIFVYIFRLFLNASNQKVVILYLWYMRFTKISTCTYSKFEKKGIIDLLVKKACLLFNHDLHCHISDHQNEFRSFSLSLLYEIYMSWTDLNNFVWYYYHVTLTLNCIVIDCFCANLATIRVPCNHVLTCQNVCLL